MCCDAPRIEIWLGRESTEVPACQGNSLQEANYPGSKTDMHLIDERGLVLRECVKMGMD